MMDTRFVVRGPHSQEKIKAYQRLKGAGRDLAEALAEQREQMKRLQGNLNSLDEALDRVTDSMARAASAGGDEE
tara:strand:+ start:195 stop:416 length:222 start_codon:yes stop_codon:yes gene_type:complete